METQKQPSPDADDQPPETADEAPEESLPSPGWHAVSRGVALFLGAFVLLHVFGGIRQPGLTSDFWWLDLRPCPAPIARGALALTGTLLLLFGMWSRIPGFFRGLGTVGTLLMLFFAARGVATYYMALRREEVASEFPVPFELHLSACLIVVLAGLLAASRPSQRPMRTFALLTIAAAVCAATFPLAHIYCIGKIDFRRQADAVVVFGHRASGDIEAEASRTLSVETACELVRTGLAKKLILVAGPDDGNTDEIELMRRQALKLGTPSSDIIVDEVRGDIRAGVESTSALLNQLGVNRVLIVSGFYQLPRIRLYYHGRGLSVWTVPAGNGKNTNLSWQLVANEVISLWHVYLEPLLS